MHKPGINVFIPFPEIIRQGLIDSNRDPEDAIYVLELNVETMQLHFSDDSGRDYPPIDLSEADFESMHQVLTWLTATKLRGRMMLEGIDFDTVIADPSILDNMEIDLFEVSNATEGPPLVRDIRTKPRYAMERF